MIELQSWLNTLGPILGAVVAAVFGTINFVLWLRTNTHVKELAHNTNSIQEAMVKTTGEKGRLEGREEMRKEQAAG